MDNRKSERMEELPIVETPDDVAVLYSWANLHGAKYRDFSASRREYRAQLRHRAAEQAREQELRAQANAESAASFAERTARQAEELAMANQARDTEQMHQKALQEAEEAARVAHAERIEAARRAEAAALAQAAALREEREIAEAHASARRQAAQYADSEIRLREAEREFQDDDAEPAVPGEISDPYTPHAVAQPRPAAPHNHHSSPSTSAQRLLNPYRQYESAIPAEPLYSLAPAAPHAHEIEYAPAPESPIAPQPPRRPQGYRPDDASGVRQIYRGPEFETPRDLGSSHSGRVSARHSAAQPEPPAAYPSSQPRAAQPPAQPQARQDRASAWADGLAPELGRSATSVSARQSVPTLPPAYTNAPRTSAAAPEAQAVPAQPQPGSTPRRRRQDAPGYKQEHPSDSGLGRRRDDVPPYRTQPPANAPVSRRPPAVEEAAPRAAAPAPEPSGPAWLYAAAPAPQPTPVAPPVPVVPQSSVAETLQHSRERVASRWYALKGVFEQPGQELNEPPPVRQKETRTPILAIYSMAGGVGKTSLVATLGRSLSSLGEKVLLTDTTSHGLLPYYFGASELRQGTVRTFSPPSGSTDAPIYLVSYDVEQKAADEAAQDALVEEITGSSRGTHRVLLDLSVSSGWLIRRMARLNPTVLVPVAPDMNSVISLGAVEKFFSTVLDSEGRPIKLFFLLNQFDASLPLHLDIREVLRRQLGDRLLPFVIRRAPAVGEALAEGMTIVDYSPEAPVAEDYLNAATWLRTVAAPATAGFRNVRWSER